jgi:hypothetical protein
VPVPGSQAPDVPRLPVTWRPFRARVVAYTLAAAAVTVATVVAVILPADGPNAFALADRVAFVGVAVVVAAMLSRLARPRLVADEAGLTVVNLFRTRRLVWAEVVRVTFRPGDPWVILELDDGETTLAAMGIQASDGPAARVRAGQLRALLAERSRTERDD